MKYALIGCGRIAVNHIKAVVNNRLELVAVCDKNPEHIELLLNKTEFNEPVERYTDYHKMLDDHPDLELISIATDSGIHAEIALCCINKGINVIIEKPIAMSLADADEIIKSAEEHGVKVSACHQNRFNIAVQEMRNAVESGRFGKISHGSIHVRWNRPVSAYELQRCADGAMCLSHALRICLYQRPSER